MLSPMLLHPRTAAAIALSATTLALLAAAAPAGAQEVRGRMVEEGSAQPVAGAIIVGVDSAGRDVVKVLTDGGGRFVLRLPHPGTWRLRGERIGFRNTLSRPLALAAAEVASTTLPAPAEPVRLAAIEVKSARRCTIRPAEGRATARVWEEARKALETAALTSHERLLRFDMVRSERRLDPRTLTVQHEDLRDLSGYSDNPIRSLPAANLADSGYVRPRPDGSTDYFAPDAGVLLSDLFLDSHCLRLSGEDPPAPDEIGVAFEPVRGHRAHDIDGVLWLDRTTAELRTLDFHYADLPQAVDLSRVGGHVEFERVRGGGWIVRRWWIRMPIVRQNLGYFDQRTVRSQDLLALHESGGEVTRIEGAGPGALSATRRAAVHGVVWDSAASAPLAGARVFLSGTNRAATTDSAGRYRIEGIPAGSYAVSFSDAALEEMGVPAPAVQIQLHPGDEAAADLAAPSTATALATVCPPDARDDTTGFAFGVVRDSATGRPAAGAVVTLRWTWYDMRSAGGRTQVSATPLGVEVEADGRGRWKVCRLQADRTIAAAAAWGGHASAPVTFEVARTRWARQDLRVGLAPVRRGDLARMALDALGTPDGMPGRATGARRAAAPARGGGETSPSGGGRGRGSRREALTGDHFTRAAIAQMGAHDLLDVLRRMPSLRVHGAGAILCVEASRGLGQAVPVGPEPVTPGKKASPTAGAPGTQAATAGNPMEPRADPGLDTTEPSACQWPAVYVNDGPLPSTSAASLLRTLDLDRVDRVEYLSPAMAQTRYGSRVVNGALVITTRR